MKIPRIDMVNPPMVPAASGNQNASLSGPNINGINPSMVEITVRKIGVILAFHASGKGARRAFWAWLREVGYIRLIYRYLHLP